MNQAAISLHPHLLRAYPGAALELAPDGRILAANGTLESRLGGAPVVGRVLSALVDRDSLPKLGALLQPADPGAAHEPVEINLVGPDRVETVCFFAVHEPQEARVLLLEQPRDPQAGSLHDELNEVNAELVTTQRELSKKTARLSRMVEEVERKLEENERLSNTLQRQNEEMEAQNEELLAMTQELHAGQEELMGANHQLERRSRELQVALSARNRFYAAMSHELRTPINAVMGYNDLLLAGIYGALSEQQELAVERSQRAARHLRELVNDILDISKIELGRMEIVLEPVAIAELVQSLFVTLRPIAESQGTPLHLVSGDCPAEIRTDPRCVRQILLNLISQAIKMGGGHPVFVQCGPAPDGVSLDITDGGAGMSAEDLSGMFEEFAPMASGGIDSTVFGTGLGLPVAHRLTALIGGRLEASSAPGLGNVFRLFLPTAPSVPLPPTV